MPRPPTDTGSPRSEPGPASAASGQQSAQSIRTYVVSCLVVGISIQIAVNYVIFNDIKNRINDLSHNIDEMKRTEFDKTEGIKKFLQDFKNDSSNKNENLRNIIDYIETEKKNRIQAIQSPCVNTPDPPKPAVIAPTTGRGGTSPATAPSGKPEDGKNHLGSPATPDRGPKVPNDQNRNPDHKDTKDNKDTKDGKNINDGKPSKGFEWPH